MRSKNMRGIDLQSALDQRRQIHFHHVPAETLIVIVSPGLNRLILLDKPGTVEIWTRHDARADPREKP